LVSRVEVIGERLGFYVFDVDGNAVLPLSSWHARWARKPETLRWRINMLRQCVEDMGHSFSRCLDLCVFWPALGLSYSDIGGPYAKVPRA